MRIVKTAGRVFVQMVLFFVVSVIGSFVSPFHLRQVISTTPSVTRIYAWDGLVCMVLLLAVIVGIEAVRKRMRTAAPWTLLAFVLVALLGRAMQFGFLTIDR